LGLWPKYKGLLSKEVGVEGGSSKFNPPHLKSLLGLTTLIIGGEEVDKDGYK
jgi:hypothetical protein